MTKHLLKLCVFVAMLVCGTSAWGQTTEYYSNDYSNGTVTWTTSTSGRFTPVILQATADDATTNYLSVDQSTRNNNGCTLTSTEASGKVTDENGAFTMTCRVKLGASTNQTATAFKIMDKNNANPILQLAEGATYATKWQINGSTTQTATVSAGGGKEIDALSWISIQVTYYEGNVYLTLKDANGAAIDSYEKTLISAMSTVGGVGNLQFVTSRYNANFAIDDIVIRSVDLDNDVPEIASHNYTVNAVCGTTQLKELATGTAKEGAKYTVSTMKVISYDGKYYEQENSSTMTDFSKTYTMGTEDQTQTINYVLAEGIVYYSEGEGKSQINGSTNDATCSGGAYGTYVIYNASKYVGLGSLEAGKSYQMEMNVKNRPEKYATNLYAHTAEGNTLLTTIPTSSSNGLKISDVFSYTKSYDLYLQPNGGNGVGPDYLLVRKVSDYPVIGAIDKSTAYRAVKGDDITLAKGDKYYVKFQNHGSSDAVYKNWLMDITSGTDLVTTLRADWYAFGVGSFTNPYTFSTDGGATTSTGSVWDTFSTDMTDATVELTLAYSASGDLTVDGTMTKGNDIYYYNYKLTNSYSVTTGEGDAAVTTNYTLADNITLNLSVEAAYLEIIKLEKYHKVTCAAVGDGTVTATPTEALSGTEISIETTPGENYQLSSVTVKAGEDDVTVTDGKFTMPASDVTVTAKFITTHSYTVKAMCDDIELATLATGTILGGETYTVTGMPEVISKDGKYYEISGVTDHSATFTMGDADVTNEIAYVLNENIAYFGEWETAFSTSSTNYKVADRTTFSGGQGRTINRTGSTMSISFDITTPGVYTITMPQYNSNSKDRTNIYTIDEGTSESITQTANSGSTYSKEVFFIAGSHKVSIGCSYSITSEFDYLKVVKTGDVPTITRSTTTGKYGTICAPAAVTVEGATVYSAAIKGDAVELTEVSEMAAGTPYIYKATADAQTFTYTSATVAEPVAALPLVGVFVNTIVDINSTGTNYVLQDQGEGQKFYQITSESGEITVPAYKAYLTTTATEAKALRLTFGEETAISAVNALVNGEAKIYDINGRRLNSLQKGINIVNGVKVLVK